MTEEREPDQEVSDPPSPAEEASEPDLGSSEGAVSEEAASEVTESDAEDTEASAERSPRADTGPDGEELERPSPEQVAATGGEFVTGLLEAMGLEGEVATRLDDETAHIEVTGESLGVLIGRRGQTLDALQEVTRTAVQRRLRSRIRLMVDVEAYRARRRASLAEYAREMAARAKERGTEIELEPMPPYERKIVHDAVSEVDGASSYSEGEDPDRKVVIRGE